MFTPAVRKALDIFIEAGYQAYVVGGAVRDYLLGKEPREYDIATDACPETTLKLAAKHGVKAFRKGVAFGVTSWLVDGQEIEIATFRTEWYGNDAHRPAKVDFVWHLEDDLARRDFTINAMAMSRDGELIDPFGGREDLERRLIRAVGDPEERLAEDALRAFRAARFVAEYGFDVEPATRAAIPRVLWRIQGLSVERVRAEIERVLVAPFAARGLRFMEETGLLTSLCHGRSDGHEEEVPVLPELARLKGVCQNPRYHRYNVWEHTLRVVEGVPPEVVLRWAALLHDVAKGLPGVRGTNREGEPTDHGHAQVGARMAREILLRLRVAPALAERVAWLVKNHMDFPPPVEKRVIRWLRRLAASFYNREQLHEAVQQLLTLREADLLAGKVDIEARLEQNRALREKAAACLERVPFFAADLRISGGEVAAVTGRGPQVKEMLDDLLARVQAGTLENTPAALQEALARKAARAKPEGRQEHRLHNN
ncbi:MAG: CCA tRNA nucleotidyltransferase [Bacillota bacterium]